MINEAQPRKIAGELNEVIRLLRSLIATLLGGIPVDICPVNCNVPVTLEIDNTGLLAQILTAVQNIDIDADSIVIDADQINLNTDQLESLLIEIRDLLIILDRDYGVVGAETLRTAAQIGNSTGAASFNAGITTAQTLRVVLPTDQTPIPVTFPAVAQVLTSLALAGGGPPFAVPAGATSVIFKTSATYTGSINGLARVGSTAYSYESAAGKILPSIICTVLSGTVDIEYLI